MRVTFRSRLRSPAESNSPKGDQAMASLVNVSRRFPGTFEKNFFDVDRTVAYDGVNQYEDVVLVQYLLKTIFKCFKVKPLGEFHVDGIFGPITHYWLLYFYEFCRFGMENEGLTFTNTEVGSVASIRNPGVATFSHLQTMIGQ